MASSTATAPRQSILLNPTSLVLDMQSALSSSSSSSSSLSSRRPRIRFAPLPEPRHDDSPCTDTEDDDDDYNEDGIPSESEISEERDAVVVDPSPSSPALSTQSAPPVGPVSRISKVLRLLRPASPTPVPRDDVFRPRSRSPPPSSPSSSSTVLYRSTSLSSNHSRTSSDSRRHPTRPLGAGGGRHSFASKILPGPSSLSQPPSSPSTSTRGKSDGKPKYVRMLNGRIYGTKRHPGLSPFPFTFHRFAYVIIPLITIQYTVHSNANPFASARDEPEFVEWGYGGMGSVRASKDVASAVWKGLHANGNPDTSPHKTSGLGAGGGRSAASARRMAQVAPESSMGSVIVGGGDDDDGSGMGWVKRRKAEREARLRAELEAKERAEREAGEGEKEPRKSGESMSASTLSTSTSSGGTTGAGSSPISSTSTSVTDLSSPAGHRTTAEHKDAGDHQHHQEHHVMATVLGPISNKQAQSSEPSPIESKASSSPGEGDDDNDEEEEEEELDTHSRMARGAGVEKVSKHVGGGGGGVEP
ncbi:hypothetical protein EV401DRAFT_2066984 [Pisolithus croceorrhizus]|nr:hypothetical protein EV401DRAFT_2066984 [Pisolithus croceorrhizus]